MYILALTYNMGRISKHCLLDTMQASKCFYNKFDTESRELRDLEKAEGRM